MTDHIDTCVIGGGVIGLAIGRALSQAASDVLVLEQADDFGTGVSSRNSEVIHAGIYYPGNSLKSVFCLKGKSLLYEYCEQRNIPAQNCGKLIVATIPEEEEALEKIRLTAFDNGVEDLTYWSEQELKKKEPSVRATSVLFSPSTGIVSSHELMSSLSGDIANHQGQLVLNTQVISVTRETSGFTLTCMIDGEPYSIITRVLVNAAGLGAQDLASRSDFIKTTDIPTLYLCKGSYYVFSGSSPFNHLIYPVPEKSGAGLGVHATIDLGGQLKFGPDVEYIDAEDYSLSTDREEAYYGAIRRYFPDLQDGQLQPGYVGIRPKLQGPGDTVR
ncbi:MAG TPA: NAD(P)/FAD-dependent oxidoreductase, partial [Pseudomonadales bacterium]|nr:NAD(P)/FAD-dependent oxidoreductase [Pseudomonadales bacterium]